MKDYIIRATDKGGNIRVFIAKTTGIVEEARKIHNTTPIATAALGRTLTGTVIMGNMLKNEKDSVSVQVKGDGPIGTILTVSNNKGEVKGYISNPNIDLPLKSNGKLDVGGAVGRNGKLIVIRDFGLKEPYVGQSNIVTGEIAEDLTHYFAYSEQQPSAVALGVLVDKDLSVKASGGFIVQILPNVDENIITWLEEKLANIEPISQLIDRGYSPEDLLKYIFGELEMDIKDKTEVNFKCDCSIERIERALISIGSEELKKIIEEDGQAELVCHFCNQKYQFDRQHLTNLLDEIK